MSPHYEQPKIIIPKLVSQYAFNKVILKHRYPQKLTERTKKQEIAEPNYLHDIRIIPWTLAKPKTSTFSRAFTRATQKVWQLAVQMQLQS